ncbi:hypothetical protein B0H17DRAFT_1145978 [Mycena rosella]|uniref:Uncharacterized protein n=1 Tax=Mycena rosella TaxID=1033263 RepID=A0AAD7G5B8_MYCRO|nr:hypothetical protein B0H17DRAFT_1145978 [Mycena rosella]
MPTISARQHKAAGRPTLAPPPHARPAQINAAARAIRRGGYPRTHLAPTETVLHAVRSRHEQALARRSRGRSSSTSQDSAQLLRASASSTILSQQLHRYTLVIAPLEHLPAVIAPPIGDFILTYLCLRRRELNVLHLNSDPSIQHTRSIELILILALAPVRIVPIRDRACSLPRISMSPGASLETVNSNVSAPGFQILERSPVAGGHATAPRRPECTNLQPNFLRAWGVFHKLYGLLLRGHRPNPPATLYHFFEFGCAGSTVQVGFKLRTVSLCPSQFSWQNHIMVAVRTTLLNFQIDALNSYQCGCRARLNTTLQLAPLRVPLRIRIWGAPTRVPSVRAAVRSFRVHAPPKSRITSTANTKGNTPGAVLCANKERRRYLSAIRFEDHAIEKEGRYGMGRRDKQATKVGRVGSMRDGETGGRGKDERITGGSAPLRPAAADEHPQGRTHGNEDGVWQPQRERQQRTHQIEGGWRSGGACGARLLTLRVRGRGRRRGVGGRRGGEAGRRLGARGTRGALHAPQIGLNRVQRVLARAQPCLKPLQLPWHAARAGTDGSARARRASRGAARGGRRRAREEGEAPGTAAWKTRSIRVPAGRVRASCQKRSRSAALWVAAVELTPKTVNRSHLPTTPHSGPRFSPQHSPSAQRRNLPAGTESAGQCDRCVPPPSRGHPSSFRAPLELKLLVEPRVPRVAEFRAPS